jgi:hypothetical protein
MSQLLGLIRDVVIGVIIFFIGYSYGVCRGEKPS